MCIRDRKGVAQKIVYGAFTRVEEKTEKPALEVFEAAMNNVMPVLEVKARRIGGATYQVPVSYTHLDVYKRQAIPLQKWDFHRKSSMQKTKNS